MKKVLKAGIMAGIGVGAGVIAAGGFVFHEAISKDAKLFQMILGSIFAAETSGEAEENTSNYKQWLQAHNAETLYITSKAGNKLAATYVPSKINSDVFVLCSHGYRNNGDNEFAKEAEYFYEKGYHFVCIDHQAAGRSEGKYIGFGYLEAADGLQWIDYLLERFGNDIQIILNGISMGSATVLMMSGNSKLPENVKFTIADCSYTSAWEEMKYITKNIVKIPKYPLLPVIDLFNKKIAAYSLKQANPIESVEHAVVPVLFFHGNRDTFVPTYMGKELYEKCTSEKELVIVEGAAHGESYQKAPELYQKHIEEFSARYINTEKGG